MTHDSGWVLDKSIFSPRGTSPTDSTLSLLPPPTSRQVRSTFLYRRMESAPLQIALPPPKTRSSHWTTKKNNAKKDRFDSRRDRSPQTVTSKFSTGASKSMYQACPRTVAFTRNKTNNTPPGPEYLPLPKDGKRTVAVRAPSAWGAQLGVGSRPACKAIGKLICS